MTNHREPKHQGEKQQEKIPWSTPELSVIDSSTTKSASPTGPIWATRNFNLRHHNLIN